MITTVRAASASMIGIPARGPSPVRAAGLHVSLAPMTSAMSVGYAGVDNDLFFMDKTMMLFGDGKKMMNELNSAVKEL